MDQNDRDDHSLLRLFIREQIVITEGLEDMWASVKSGVGSAFDYAQGTSLGKALGIDRPEGSGLLRSLEDLAPDEVQASVTDLGRTNTDFADEKTVPTKKSVRSPDGSLHAVIVGDSQVMSGMGQALRADLVALGYTVDVFYKNGAPSSYVASLLEQNVSGADLAVAIFGGNDSGPTASTESLKKMASVANDSGTYLIAVGPAPATRATRPDIAARVFGPAAADPDYQLERSGGSYARQRVEIAQAIEDEAREHDNVKAYGIAARLMPGTERGADDFYPDQPDGIHCNSGGDYVAGKILDAIGIDEITSEIRQEGI